VAFPDPTKQYLINPTTGLADLSSIRLALEGPPKIPITCTVHLNVFDALVEYAILDAVARRRKRIFHFPWPIFAASLRNDVGDCLTTLGVLH
jgi:hypothetical protein